MKVFHEVQERFSPEEKAYLVRAYNQYAATNFIKGRRHCTISVATLPFVRLRSLSFALFESEGSCYETDISWKILECTCIPYPDK